MGPRDLRGQRIAIAGATHGVGWACAQILAAQGARLFLAARSARELDARAQELRATASLLGHDAAISSLAIDLSTEAGATAFAAQAMRALGGLDFALSCAGASAAGRGLASDRFDSDPRRSGARAPLDRLFLEQLQANALAPALPAIALARAALAAPPSESPPHILVLGSMVTRRPAMPGLAHYLAAKSALDAIVRTLAEETWPRARINVLCLGPVATRLHEQAGTPRELIEQFPQPDEIAPLVLETLWRARELSGRALEADALAAEPDAALWADGKLAGLLDPRAPGEAAVGTEQAPEPEPGRAPSTRVRRALRQTATTLQRYPAQTRALMRRLAALHRVDESQIALSGGGASLLLERALQAVAAPGDELVSPFPTFELVSALASRLGLRERPVPAPRDPHGLFAPHSARPLLAALGPRTRAIYLATPDNPTGASLPGAAGAPGDELRALLAGLPPHTALLLDEAWSLEVPGDELARDAPRSHEAGTSPYDLMGTPTIPPLIRLRSLSKLFGLAGLRIGYAIAAPGLAALLRRLELPFPLGAPQLAAALAALDELPRARKIARALRARRERLVTAIRALGLLASEGDSPLILLRDPAPGANAGRLLFALRAAGLPAQEAHWDPAALTVSVGRAAQDRRLLAALGRALE